MPLVAIASILAVLLALPVHADPKPLAVGAQVPEIAYEDINGDAGNTSKYGDWVRVLSFADKDSSEEMKLWLSDAQKRVTRAHPELAVAYLSFADLSIVPRFMRGLARPLLRRSFENSNEELAESYAEAGIPYDPAKTAFVFIPDWDGGYLTHFGLANATAFHLWVARGDEIVLALDPSTPDIADRYVAAFDEIAGPRPGSKPSGP